VTAFIASHREAHGSPAGGQLRIALRATAPRAALAPGDPCGPSDQEKRAGPSLPRPDAGASRTARAGHDHHNRMLHGLRGTPTRQSRLPARPSNVYQRSSSW
jgi:hypothetical protein